ncbi:hypothetical protein [Desulfuromonas sp.]|uniref:hypothetical protein n=1 Tax=Desulfuromonas sp. TaxID=892 RepID=UPI0025BB1548|nr:hypothetical protein [Desulfuromonas sp.]
MECPICKRKNHVEIDTHSDGFAENLQECGDCGALWTSKEGKEIIVHGATQLAASNS